MWDSMIEICHREFCKPDDVCSYVAERKPPHGLAELVAPGFHASSTGDGHLNAGHGQSMFMSQQEERWLMREIRTRRTTGFRTD